MSNTTAVDRIAEMLYSTFGIPGFRFRKGERVAERIYANEIAPLVEAAAAALDFLDDRADADCVGDPPRFEPNEAMRLGSALFSALDRVRTPTERSEP